MSCNCCGEDNKLLFCERCDCDICVECIESGNLESYGCDNCDEKESCDAYEYGIKTQVNESNTKELEKKCREISDFLYVNFNPYTSVIITGDKIQIFEDKVGIPIKRKKTKKR